MDLESLEIYIPVEADVKNIPLWSLPNSVLRRMGIPQSDTKGSRKLTESPEGIWICPAVLRRKGHKRKQENMSSVMGRELRSATGPLRMSFVSSNRAAYRVLKETMPDSNISAHTSHTSPLPLGPAPETSHDAVVIYHGRVYLSIRKSSRSRSQRETQEPQPAVQSPIPSTSGMSSKSQLKCPFPQASVEPAEVQRKRSLVALPRISPKQPKDLLTKTDSHSTTDQELLSDSRAKKKQATCKVPHSQNRKDVAHKGRDMSSSKTARAVPQSTDSVFSVHGHYHNDTREEHAVWIQPQGEQEEEMVNHDSDIQDLGAEEAESTSHNDDMDGNMKIDSGDNIAGFEEQSSNQSWSRREPQGASTSLPREFDHNQLAQEDRITLIKAKLKQKEAALNNQHSL